MRWCKLINGAEHRSRTSPGHQRREPKRGEVQDDIQSRLERTEHLLARTAEVQDLAISTLQRATERLARARQVLHESRLRLPQADGGGDWSSTGTETRQES